MPENPYEPPQEVNAKRVNGAIGRIVARAFLATFTALSAAGLIFVVAVGAGVFWGFFALGVVVFGGVLALHVWLER